MSSQNKGLQSESVRSRFKVFVTLNFGLTREETINRVVDEFSKGRLQITDEIRQNIIQSP